MTLLEQLSHAGIPWGIRRNGTLFVMAGDRVLNVKGMTFERVKRARAEETEKRDSAFNLKGYWAEYSQERRQALYVAKERLHAT